jgi:hypothetical protein
MNTDITQINPSIILDPEEPDKLFHEINLLRIEGCYFSFNRYRKIEPKKDSKKVFTDTLKTANGTIETSIAVEPHPTYGQPATLAYKILQVILKKYSSYGLPFPKGIPLGQREIAKLIGRKTIGGKDSQEFDRAVKQLRRTGVECSFYFKQAGKENKSSGQWKAVDFSILTTSLLSGRREGHIEQGFFCLHPIIINSLTNRYLNSCQNNSISFQKGRWIPENHLKSRSMLPICSLKMRKRLR